MLDWLSFLVIGIVLLVAGILLYRLIKEKIVQTLGYALIIIGAILIIVAFVLLLIAAI
jgi:hypothetical protein